MRGLQPTTGKAAPFRVQNSGRLPAVVQNLGRERYYSPAQERDGMFIYIVEQADQVSGSYHSGGGISIVAESPEAALELANKTPDVTISAADIAGGASYELVGLPEPKVYIFPDAGCC